MKGQEKITYQYRNLIHVLISVKKFPDRILSWQKYCHGEFSGYSLNRQIPMKFYCLTRVLLLTITIKGGPSWDENFIKILKKSSLYSQSHLIFIHTLVVKRHPITREIRDLLWSMSTPTRNTVYFYMSSSFIYTLKIHRRSFNHSVQ